MCAGVGVTQCLSRPSEPQATQPKSEERVHLDEKASTFRLMLDRTINFSQRREQSTVDVKDLTIHEIRRGRG